MKTPTRFKLILSILIACMGLSWTVSCTFLRAEDKVKTAYDMRMDGHADSAVIMLDALILEDQDNAAAYYELARAKMHIMLNNGKYELADIITDASKASELMPDNEAYAYMAASAKFLDVYMQLMRGNEDIDKKFQLAMNAYEHVLEIQPCCPSVLITLTEVYSMLPAEMGGDPALALQYAQELESCNPLQGLKAKALLQDTEEDLLNYWLEEYEKNEINSLVSEELGRAYLMNGDIKSAKIYLHEAHELDKENCVVLLDLARASMMVAMERQDKNLGEDAILAYQEYLDEYPDAPGPLKAYVYRMMALTSGRIIGNEALAEEYRSKEQALDPFCSRAFGSPSMALFVPPGEMYEGTGYYSRPF